MWIKTSHDLYQPWQKIAIKEKAASTSQPPALYISPIPLKPAKVEELKKIVEKHLPAGTAEVFLLELERRGVRIEEVSSIRNSYHPAVHSAGKSPVRRAFGIAPR